MVLLKKQLILEGLMISGAVIGSISYVMELDIVIKVIGILIGVIIEACAFIYLITKYRCSWCKHIYPLQMSPTAEFCPHCGDRIEE